MDANANPGLDTINFNLPGSGVQTIAPTNVLPDITGPVAINGYSQPGSSANTLTNGDNAVILVRLDEFKVSSGSPAGLNFTGTGASGSSVRGLCLVRCYRGIQVNETANITIAGNWIGMDVDGVARGATFEGIYVYSFFNPASNILIGGTTPADRNVIAGNRYGIYFSGSATGNSSVQGNFIGTDPSGTLPRGNAFGGIYIFTGTNITIGGAAAGAQNIISGATAAGGTGVSSPRSMIHDLIAEGYSEPIVLVHGVRAEADLYGREEFESLAKAHPNFRYVPALSNERRMRWRLAWPTACESGESKKTN